MLRCRRLHNADFSVRRMFARKKYKDKFRGRRYTAIGTAIVAVPIPSRQWAGVAKPYP